MKHENFQSLDPIEVAKRAGFDINEAGRIGDPLRIVMTALSCSEQDAKKWLSEKFGGQENDDIELVEGNVKPVKMAQDFAEDMALYTIGLYARRQQKIVEQPYVITSKRELFPCTPKELAARSICYDKIPFPVVRWPLASVRQYRSSGTTSTLRECYDGILSLIEYHLDFGDKETSKLVALWIIGTYCYRLFESFPYLHLNGNAECGKTKVLRLISLLSFNGEMMTSDSSRAAMLRTIDANSCACCIDEVEGLQNPKDDDTRAVLAVLNTGYKLGGGDKKCEKVGKSEQWIPVFYDGYSPKVLAGIKQIAPVLQTRCIPIVMLRSRNKEILNRAIHEKDPRWEQLRSMLYPSMLENWKDVREVFSSIRSLVLTAREWELWKPIITIASIIDPSGQLANDMRRQAEKVQTQRKEADIGAPNFLKVLVELMNIHTESEKFYSTEDLYECFADADEDEYGWLIDPHKKSFRGKWLGNEMRRCGVVRGKAELKSICGKKYKGYTLRREHIEGLLSAYDMKTVTDKDSVAQEKAEITVTAK